jgi:hypothetical protein
MADARADLDTAQHYAKTAFELSAPGSVAGAAGLLGMCLLDAPRWASATEPISTRPSA